MSGPFINTGFFRTPLTENNSTQQEELGVWRFDSGKIFKYVKAGALIPAFEPVRLDTTRTDGNQVLQISGVTDMCLGIAETTLASGNFGWITMYGPATARVTTGTIPLSSLYPSGNTGVLQISSTCSFNACAVTVQSGLSFGSAIFVMALGG